MVRGWICDRCERVHTGNPTECRSCGHHVLRPASGEELQKRASGTSAPEPIDLDSRPSYGGTPEEELHSGPDLNPDGSIKNGTETPNITSDEIEVDRAQTWSLRRVLLVAGIVALLVLGGVFLTGGL